MTATVALEHHHAPDDQRAGHQLSSLAIELTGACQLSCTHCYAQSGPTGSHGTMTLTDWRHVLDDAAQLGVGTVQFIGGEPTRHPHLPELLDHAIGLGLRVEVFTNLLHITDTMWQTLGQPGVRLATSYYNDRPAEHATITGRLDAYARTRTNIVEALRRRIPLRASTVAVLDGQRVEEAEAELRALGVTDIRVDRLRLLGRPDTAEARSVGELCGQCGLGRAAVGPDGAVTPCVMGRWLIAGYAHHQPLAEILDGPLWHEHLATVPRRGATACNPNQDGSDCAPAETEACNPAY